MGTTGACDRVGETAVKTDDGTGDGTGDGNGERRS
jgi:hypothetical protein